jgi:hypothetical protein
MAVRGKWRFMFGAGVLRAVLRVRHFASGVRRSAFGGHTLIPRCNRRNQQSLNVDPPNAIIRNLQPMNPAPAHRV